MHKYGHVIGMTGAAVRAGEHVHTHNLTMPPNATEVATSGPAAAVPEVPADLPRTFDGIVRPDGRVATRNYIGVLTTVNCSATVAKQIVRRTEDEIAEMHAEGVDGVVALTHGTGCGMANSGPGWDVLRRTLAGYARHPNIGGLVVVGLGCEINVMRSLVDEMDLPAWLPHVVVHHPGRRRHRGRGPRGRPPGARDGRGAARHPPHPRRGGAPGARACSAAARTRGPR